jgi:ankyrin repeat protein
VDVFEAATAGDLERIQQLVVNEPSVVEAWSQDGFTALHLASHYGHEAVAETLLRHGASIDTPSRNDMKVTPIHAAAAGRSRELVSLLLTYGAEPNARQRHGWTALHAAAQHGDTEMVRVLLDAHAEPGLANDDGRTPLDLAREEGHQEVVALLENWTPGES